MSRSHLPPDTNVVEIWGKFLFGVDCHNLLFIFSVSLCLLCRNLSNFIHQTVNAI